jgi:hypothetical protein
MRRAKRLFTIVESLATISCQVSLKVFAKEAFLGEFFEK